MEASPQPRSPVAMGVAMGVAVGAGCLALAFFFAARAFPGRHVTLRPHPFGLDAGVSINRGADFNGEGGRKEPLPGIRKFLESMRWQAPGDTFVVGPEALAAIDSGLTRFRDHPFWLYLRGRVLETLGRVAEAESCYALSKAVSPQFAFPRVRLGDAHLRAGLWLPAEAEYRAALSLWVSDPKAYGSGPGAMPSLEQPPYAGLAQIFYRLGFPDSAAMVIEYARQQGVSSDEMDFVQGLIAEEHTDLRSADSIYRALASRHPADPRYADASATLGLKPPRGGLAPAEHATAVFAISLLEPLTARFPKNAPLYLALGQAYLHRGLYALSAAALDSALRLDSSLAEARPLREAAYRQLREVEDSQKDAPHSTLGGTGLKATKPGKKESDEEGAVKVIIPGNTGLLGTYSVPWGATPGDVRRAYPGKLFSVLPNGNLRETFVEEGLKHDYLLAFHQGELWGMFVTVTDTTGHPGDFFGHMLQLKSKISGEGHGTGETTCSGGGKGFQGVIWENDDTFEFLAQFHGHENQVRLARLARTALPRDRRVCDLERFLEPETWK